MTKTDLVNYIAEETGLTISIKVEKGIDSLKNPEQNIPNI